MTMPYSSASRGLSGSSSLKALFHIAGQRKLPRSRRISSKTCTYILLLMPPNFSCAQPESAGASSLRKMPRYFTVGPSSTSRTGRTWTVSRCTVGTSAHQYQGDTPICSDSS